MSAPGSASGVLAALALLLSIALQGALILGVPWAVARLGRRALDRVAPDRFFDVPLVIGIARLFGILLGALLLAGRADAFDLRLLFGPQSPWNLTAWRFLVEPANPLWLVGGFAAQSAGRGFVISLAGLATLVGLLALALLITPFAFWERQAYWRAVIGGAGVALITAYFTIYSISLLFWMAFWLNFWMLAVLLVILQWYRRKTK